ncbi:MAG: hypothetical protein PHG41_06995 [Actinomycetota bacterium]|nr:hypothetical protein [Actinomycetota bacterium]
MIILSDPVVEIIMKKKCVPAWKMQEDTPGIINTREIADITEAKEINRENFPSYQE